jgi:hypothetical protein
MLPYMNPNDTTVDVVDGDTANTNPFIMLPANAVIYGKVVIDGAWNGGNYQIGAHSDSGYGNSGGETDAQGSFQISVHDGGSYHVNLELNSNNADSLPGGYMVKNGNQRSALPGDTVVFELVPENGGQPDTGNGEISGLVSYAGSLPQSSIRVILLSGDTEMKQRDVRPVDSLGRYLFDKLPPGRFQIMAIIDTNNDHAPEAMGQNDSLITLVDSEKIASIDVTILDKPTGTNSISGTVSHTDPLPPNSIISIYAMSMDTLLPADQRFPSLDLALAAGYAVTLDSLGDYTVDGLPDSEYGILVLVMNQGGGDPWAFGAYGTIGGNGPPDFTPVSVRGTNATGIDISLVVDSSKNGGEGKISGTINYSGSLPDSAIRVILLGNDSGSAELKEKNSCPVDSLGRYMFDRVAPGNYMILAVIDTNNDHAPEAMGRNDSIMVVIGQENFFGIDITLEDKATGVGAISGSLTYSGILPPNAVITVYAIPMDTSLPPDQRLPNFDLAIAAAYAVTLDDTGAYLVSGLPDSAYGILALVDTSAGGFDGEPMAFGVYGAFSDSGSPDFIPVGVQGDTVTGIDLDLQPKIGVEKAKAPELPTVFALGRPSPNPFNPTVSLTYAVPRSTAVMIKIYDIRGRMVCALVNAVRQPGYYQTVWNGVDSYGRALASGIYICRLQAGTFVKQQKMLMMK